MVQFADTYEDGVIWDMPTQKVGVSEPLRRHETDWC